MRCYLFDIDGTLANIDHRLHHIKGCGKKRNWDAFFAACADDTPIEHMCEVARALISRAPLVFVSGRSDVVRDQTQEWLTRHGLYGRLYMRKAGDHRADNIVKAELLDQIIADGYEPVLAFEDRKQVVAMWRERGIPCAQVAEGDF